MTEQEIDIICEWIFDYIRSNSNDLSAYDAEKDFRKYIKRIGGNKEEIPPNLTWQDIKRIVNIADNAINDGYKDSHGVLWDEEGYYTEVLKRFKEGIEV